MVDTERFQLGPELVHRVTAVSAQLAAEQDGLVNPLQVVPYLPIDAESVGRALESVEEDLELERVEREGICFFEFDDPEVRVERQFDLEAGEQLEDLEQLEDNLLTLNLDDDWGRKVREQHALLRVAAEAERRRLEPSAFVEGSEVASSRVRSLLNDFCAEGYAASELGEDEESLAYRFPPIHYSRSRYRSNMKTLDALDRTEPSKPVWGMLAATTFILLILLIVVRFYAG